MEMVWKFSCRECGMVTWETDYDPKYVDIFIYLEELGLCEECVQG